jgi:3-deoxy-D-manno-octulosonate 8-phosphate phosphatase (KDO 8-P phosphatase)
MLYFASNMRYLRVRAQATVSDFAHLLALTPDALQDYEEGIREPKLNDLLALADLLAMPVEVLLRRDLQGQFDRMRRQDIRLILLDVDGTMTDGGMYYTENGDQIKRFEVKDGIAIRRVARRYGVSFGLISSGTAEQLIRKRAAALDIDRVFAGSGVKSDIVDAWLEELDLQYDQLAYIGDDLNDLSVIQKAGLTACPADAVRQVKMSVDIVLKTPGGQGCVREFLEEVMGYDIE